MNSVPFEYTHLGGRRYRIYLDSFWAFAFRYAHEQGYERAAGKYQALPPI